MPYDASEEADIKSTTVDDIGEVLCKLDTSGGEEIENARLRSPMGARARPLDATDEDGADALFQRNGDEAEVLLSVDRAVVDKLHQLLGELPKGSYQIHSLGNEPQTITLKDDRIQIGNSPDGEKAAARVDDHVKCGQIQVIVVAPAELTVNYIPPQGGAAKPLFGITLNPAQGCTIDTPAAAGTFLIDIEGIIDKGSKLVKIAGLSE